MQAIIDNLQAQADEHRRQLALIRGALKKLREASQSETSAGTKDLAAAFKASGMSYSELGRRVGVHYRTVSRAVRGEHKRKSFLTQRLLLELTKAK